MLTILPNCFLFSFYKTPPYLKQISRLPLEHLQKCHFKPSMMKKKGDLPNKLTYSLENHLASSCTIYIDLSDIRYRK